MISFQASLLSGIVPLVLVSAGAVYVLDAWREFRIKQELSQRVVRRGAELVAERFDQVLSEARLGAQLLATGGPAGDLPNQVERIAATPLNATPGRCAFRGGAGELADRSLPAQPAQHWRRERGIRAWRRLPRAAARPRALSQPHRESDGVG